MKRALTIVLSAHWTVLFAALAIHQAQGFEMAAGQWPDAARAGASAGAAVAFFWATIAVLLGGDNRESGQGDVGRIAICIGIAACSVTSVAAVAAGGLSGAIGGTVQLGALIATIFVFERERGAAPRFEAQNDNSQAAARLLAVLAATDAKIDRIARRERSFDWKDGPSRGEIG